MKSVPSNNVMNLVEQTAIKMKDLAVAHNRSLCVSFQVIVIVIVIVFQVIVFK